jgi:hypothetical protein
MVSGDEVHASTVHIAKVAKLHITALAVLEKMHPLEQVGAHEVLEARGRLGDHRPVQVVVLLLLLDGARFRRGRRAGASRTCSVRQSRRRRRQGATFATLSTPHPGEITLDVTHNVRHDQV